MRILECLDPLRKDEMDSRYVFVVFSTGVVAHNVVEVPDGPIVRIGWRSKNLLQRL